MHTLYDIRHATYDIYGLYGKDKSDVDDFRYTPPIPLHHVIDNGMANTQTSMESLY